MRRSKGCLILVSLNDTKGGYCVIVSFKTKLTQAVWNGDVGKGFPNSILRRAQIKLAALHAAETLEDLRIPPSNRLELLKGDMSGYHSIRINSQSRICFIWQDHSAHQVEIVDYH
jgi:toxin HigB-1